MTSSLSAERGVWCAVPLRCPRSQLRCPWTLTCVFHFCTVVVHFVRLRKWGVSALSEPLILRVRSSLCSGHSSYVFWNFFFFLESLLLIVGHREYINICVFPFSIYFFTFFVNSKNNLSSFTTVSIPFSRTFSVCPVLGISLTVLCPCPLHRPRSSGTSGMCYVSASRHGLLPRTMVGLFTFSRPSSETPTESIGVPVDPLSTPTSFPGTHKRLRSLEFECDSPGVRVPCVNASSRKGPRWTDRVSQVRDGDGE